MASERYDEGESLLKKHIGRHYQQIALIMQLANIFGLKKEHNKVLTCLSLSTGIVLYLCPAVTKLV